MSLSIDYTSPKTQFAFDINKNTTVKKDNQNFINTLSIKELNTLDNVSLLDIFLSANNVIEPHYHQNAAELVYCISGAATVSILNPFTKQIQNYYITPGQVANVPQGWWHYEIAASNHTHLLAIFNAPTPEVILGSDLLTLTPANVIAHTYSIDENQWNKTIAPVKPSIFIGPTLNTNDYHQSPKPIYPSQTHSTYPHYYY